MANSQIPPRVLSFIVCDGLYRNHVTKQVSVLGIYNSTSSQKFPAVVPLGVYCELINGHGPTDFVVRIASLDGSEQVGQSKVTVDFDDPLEPSQFVVPPQLITFNGPGHYVVQLLHNGVPLSEQRLIVRQIP